MEKYDPKIIEQKWQKYWEEKNLYKAQDFSSKPKWYTLVEFPYPSGDGLHVGHVRSYTALDVISRKLRMQGYNVLYSIGWDAFGLPTENYAIKNKIHPRIATEQNIATFKRQLKSLGFSYDWSREINTTNPEYYRWTQWIFLKLFEKDLAYKKKLQVNWCPSCKIVLANEEVIDDKCERCGAQVMKKEKEQWILAISKYADRLIEDLKTVDYLEKIKTQQINWIGKSEGAQFIIKIKDIDEKIEVYTTRLDTIFGMTYAVVAPEHPIIERLKDRIDNYTEVEKYIIAAQGKTDLERTELQKEKTGVELRGVNIINPFNQEELPLYVADYVLGFYGTGAVMAVPAHDERDFEFAKKYNLPIKKVIESDKSFIVAIKKSLSNEFYNEVKKFASVTEGAGSWKDLMLIYTEEVDKVFDLAENNFVGKLWYIHSEGKIKKILFHNGGENKRFNWESDNGYKEAYDYGSKIGIAKKQLDWKGCYASFTDDGILVNSENYSNLSSQEARERLTVWLEKKNIGGKKINYKLRDWIFSRQHYWGEPIPIIHCKKCGIVPVPEIDLPVELPDVESYEPTDTGESPLAKITDWVNVKCPKCGTKGRRETDTMPNWAGSSWYFLRYIDPNNNKILADLKKLKYWMPVDLYNGGMEHTTLHLLYSRFWNKFLFDIGISPVSEPYARRRSHGMVLAEDGKKMSKSLGNVINPDDVITEFGTDTLRIYEMFMGPFEDAISWSTSSMIGVKRFLEKVYKLQYKIIADDQYPTGVKNLLHKTIKKVTEDIENFRFNTAISQLMIIANAMEKEKEIQIADYKLLITILSPFAPHITEELWEKLGNKESIFLQKWPVADEKYLKEEEIEMVVQVNGKLRDRIFVAPDVTEYEAKEMALESEKIKSFLDGKEIKKIIFVPKRLINIVIN